jgi:tRNA dimethylallyltransferase
VTESTHLLVVTGPTATGKTPLAVAVAERLGAVELVNADSRQVIRGLTVGTCAPTAAELRGVPCHLVGVRDPGEPFTVAAWLRLARPVVEDIDRRGALPLVVGGTGFYIGALVDGLDLAEVEPDPVTREWRFALAERPEGLAGLAAELGRRDPQGAAGVDLRNPRRVVRALEILDAHGTLAAAGIGYREALAVHDGLCGVDDAVDRLVRRTLRYAKAQRTWFRRDPRIRWLVRDARPVDRLAGEVIDALHQDARSGERLPGGRRP